MAGPMITGAGQTAANIAKKLAEESVKASEQVGKFDQVMNQMMDQNAEMGKTESMQATEVGQVDMSISRGNSIKDVLNGIVEGQHKVDKIMDMALSGKKFSPQELMVIQTGVYRFTQELELTSKVVEQAVSGIKTTMNTQV